MRIFLNDFRVVIKRLKKRGFPELWAGTVFLYPLGFRAFVGLVVKKAR